MHIVPTGSDRILVKAVELGSQNPEPTAAFEGGMLTSVTLN